MPNCSEVAKVAILLCVRNSAQFLREQMESYFSQDHENWELWVSDDGSTDSTRDIIGEYVNRGKRITILNGPCRGATENFLFIARIIETDADYFSWSDADDIWLPDKLSRVVQQLEEVGRNQAALSFGRTAVVDKYNRFMHLSRLFIRPPSFRNALGQNIGGGNTMVFNQKARELLRIGGMPNVIAHDWWAYILVSGCGGVVLYDPEPCLRYRQHGGNLTGSNRGLRASLFRGYRLFQGVVREWNRMNILALEERRALLTPENERTLADFAKVARMRLFWKRLNYFRRSGVHRQSVLHNIMLYAAICMGKYP